MESYDRLDPAARLLNVGVRMIPKEANYHRARKGETRCKDCVNYVPAPPVTMLNVTQNAMLYATRDRSRVEQIELLKRASEETKPLPLLLLTQMGAD